MVLVVRDYYFTGFKDQLRGFGLKVVIFHLQDAALLRCFIFIEEDFLENF